MLRTAGAGQTEEQFSPVLAPLRPGSAAQALAPAINTFSSWWRESEGRARRGLNNLLSPVVNTIVPPAVGGQSGTPCEALS